MARRLHDLVTAAVKTSLSRGLADPMRMVKVAAEIRERAGERGPVSRATIFAPAGDGGEFGLLDHDDLAAELGLTSEEVSEEFGVLPGQGDLDTERQEEEFGVLPGQGDLDTERQEEELAPRSEALRNNRWSQPSLEHDVFSSVSDRRPARARNRVDDGPLVRGGGRARLERPQRQGT